MRIPQHIPRQGARTTHIDPMKQQTEASSAAPERLSRRTFLERLAVAGLLPRLMATSLPVTAKSLRPAAAAGLAAELSSFTAIVGNNADKVRVPVGFEAQVVLRWGDGLLDYAPGWRAGEDLTRPGAAIRQARQFGDNCD